MEKMERDLYFSLRAQIEAQRISILQIERSIATQERLIQSLKDALKD